MTSRETAATEIPRIIIEQSIRANVGEIGSCFSVQNTIAALFVEREAGVWPRHDEAIAVRVGSNRAHQRRRASTSIPGATVSFVMPNERVTRNAQIE